MRKKQKLRWWQQPSPAELERPRFNLNAHGLPLPDRDYVGYLRELRLRMRHSMRVLGAAERVISQYEAFYKNKFGPVIADVELGRDPHAAQWFGARNTARARVQALALAILAEEQLSYLDNEEQVVNVGDEPTVQQRMWNAAASG